MTMSPNDITSLEELEACVRDAIRGDPDMIKSLVESWNKEDRLPLTTPLTPKEYLMEIAGFDSAEADELITRM